MLVVSSISDIFIHNSNTSFADSNSAVLQHYTSIDVVSDSTRKHCRLIVRLGASYCGHFLHPKADKKRLCHEVSRRHRWWLSDASSGPPTPACNWLFESKQIFLESYWLCDVNLSSSRVRRRNLGSLGAPEGRVRSRLNERSIGLGSAVQWIRVQRSTAAY